MQAELDQIDLLQTQAVELWHQDREDLNYPGFLGLVLAQHLENYRLWHEEDQARDPAATPEKIVAVKRAIDRHNQKRNDLIEQLDSALIEALAQAQVELPNQTPLNSETPGNMIDRCSIMALKIYHMAEQTQRTGVTEAHKAEAAQKLLRLRLQRQDLLGCMKALWAETLAGTRQFKVYRQFKMYNDPRLNPVLYQGQP